MANGMPTSVVEKFQVLLEKLVKKVRVEKLGMYEKIVITEEYEQILGMGPQIIPLLLKEIQKEKPFFPLFSILEFITGENPVRPGPAGFLPNAARDWIEWGKRKKLID